MELAAQHDDDQRLIALLAALDLPTLASDGRWQTSTRQHRLEWLTASAVGSGIAFAGAIGVTPTLCQRVDFLIGAEGSLAQCKRFVDCGSVRDA